MFKFLFKNSKEKYLDWIAESKYSACKFKMQMAWVVLNTNNQYNQMPTIRFTQDLIGLKTTQTYALFKQYTELGFLRKVGQNQSSIHLLISVS
jgi:hypothetical protein